MTKVFFLLSGGAVGTLARYGVSELSNRYFEGAFPFGTLAVNLAGSLLIGLLWGLWENDNIPANIQSFLFVGILGGFTTFSTYALDTLNLFKIGEIKMGIVNLLANNVFGVLLVLLGFVVSRGLFSVGR